MKDNYKYWKSDFQLLVKIEAKEQQSGQTLNLSTAYPFEMRFWTNTCHGNVYKCSSDGKGSRVNCTIVDNNHVMVYFDHFLANLQPGKLMMEMEIKVPNAHFEYDGIMNVKRLIYTGTILTDRHDLDVDDAAVDVTWIPIVLQAENTPVETSTAFNDADELSEVRTLAHNGSKYAPATTTDAVIDKDGKKLSGSLTQLARKVDEQKEYVEGMIVDDPENDFSIKDEEGKALMRVNGGHFMTDNFDSSKDATPTSRGLMSAEDKKALDELSEGAAVSVEDSDGDFELKDDTPEKNVVFKINGGYPKTKNFNGKDVIKRLGKLEGETAANKTILVIGDSITEGTGSTKNYKGITISNGYNYTAWMQQKNTEYTFVKCGRGGENSAAILGRVGGVPFVVDTAFDLPADTSQVEIPLVSSWVELGVDDTFSRLTHNLGGASQAVTDNPFSINGVDVTITYDKTNDRYLVARTKAGDDTMTVLGGTLVKSSFYKKYLNKVCALVFWCGSNDNKKQTHIKELAEHIKKTAAYFGTENYVVVCPNSTHRYGEGTNKETLENTKGQENVLLDAFGDKLVNWREYGCTVAMQHAIDNGYIENTGAYPTAKDLQDMAEGKVPSTFLVDTAHMCSEGYKVVGDVIYSKLVNLGYIK